MDIDKLMIEWNEQRFEGYLFDTPPAVIAADIRKKSQKRKRKYRLGNFAGIILATIIVVTAFVMIYREHTLLVRAATLILMSVNFCELLWMLKWRSEEHRKPYYLPAKTALIQERDRMRKEIRQAKWQTPWSGIAGIGGLAYFILSCIFDISFNEDILNILIGFSLPLLLIHFTVLLEIRKELPNMLEKIEQDIKSFDEVPTESLSSMDWA